MRNLGVLVPRVYAVIQANDETPFGSSMKKDTRSSLASVLASNLERLVQLLSSRYNFDLWVLVVLRLVLTGVQFNWSSAISPFRKTSVSILKLFDVRPCSCWRGA